MHWLICILLTLGGACINVALWCVVVGGSKVTVLEREGGENDI